MSFLNVVPVEKLPALYREASALVYPSFGGPENLPPLEAFSFDCPVIAADVPGAQEQLGDGAILVDPSDWRAFASAAQSILHGSSQRDALCARGKSRAMQRTSQSFVKKLLDRVTEFENMRSAWAS